MTNTTDLAVKSDDFLKDNRHIYAHKAKRKKIALISVEVHARSHSDELRVDLGAAKLIANGVFSKTGADSTPSDTPMKTQQAPMNALHLILPVESANCCVVLVLGATVILLGAL